jgi:hypothetical protein
VSVLPAWREAVVSALSVVWFLAFLLVAWGLLRAARGYRGDGPQAPARQPFWDADRERWDHEPADADRQRGTDDVLLAVCRHLWHLPDHQPTDHTEEGRP